MWRHYEEQIVIATLDEDGMLEQRKFAIRLLGDMEEGVEILESCLAEYTTLLGT